MQGVLSIMCGILGSYRDDYPVADKLDLLAHRGPDGRGVVRHGEAVHGHVRLSLMDLSDASAQPFRMGEGVLSFVGEIWNHAELRQELQATGRKFRTTGDTEVLAAALDAWGMEALPKLDGMFAFAWTSPSLKIIARDRFGKVPLYVCQPDQMFNSSGTDISDGGFIWASERRALGRPADAVPPGSVFHLDEKRLHVWYELPFPAIVEDPERTVIDVLRHGVHRRMTADAPVCVLSSGGLDSTLIMALARQRGPVTAFTAVLNDRSDDLDAARFACSELDVPLIEVPISTPTAADLDAAVRSIEIPTKAQVEIAALCIPLARAIRSHGFKACLSGEAADELFGGYGNMCIAAAAADDAGWRSIRVRQVSKMARGNFVRCNKAFMAAGVECRLPFMQRELVESVLSMTKAQCPPGKGLLKKVAENVIPRKIIRRPKDTFQGASGMKRAAEEIAAAEEEEESSAVVMYNRVIKDMFGTIIDG